eukprot:13335852-Heterocapsa_arctica.AAC.1
MDSRHDLRDVRVQAEVHEAANNADAIMGAMDFSTLSRARDRPIRGHPSPPRPLRGATNPLGLPGLSAEERAMVDEANSIVLMLGQLALKATMEGKACVLENPLQGWFWEIEPIRSLILQD